MLITTPSLAEIANYASTLKLNVPSSPDDLLYRALEWAAAHGIPPLRQRVALATLYFGTGSEEWQDQMAFLSDNDKCISWNVHYGETTKGVRCSDGGKVAIVSFCKYYLYTILHLSKKEFIDYHLPPFAGR